MRKIVINLLCHRDYFDTNTRWYFSVISHGKDACDRAGETTESSAIKVSL
jgi:hypothetical protein